MSADVVSLGAWCDLVPPNESTASPGGASFKVAEFAVLDDGRRITLHAERGFTTWHFQSGRAEPLDPWPTVTATDLEREVRNVVLPDDDDTEEEHPWEWLASLLHRHGIRASPERLKQVPYRVEFSERLLQRLGA